MKKKGIILLTLAIIIAAALGIFSQYIPKAKNSNDTGFSAERAKEHIKTIAKEPHSIYNQEALGKVREYILQELKEIGLDPEVFTYENVKDRNGDLQTINNIYAKIDGKKGEDGSYILLASHYDSSPKKRSGEDNNSHGAADAGYGVSTILEILRNIKESGSLLENGIKILITDGEEMGLLGAKEEMNKNFSNYENVSFVVNMEARGIKGPALMFETGENNEKVIELYKNAKLPVSYSLAADIYRKMPNGTDFTEFIKKGINGTNFAVLNNLDYYHTNSDIYENINERSIQHYGEQVLPMVEEFVYSEKYSDIDYFKADQDRIFFTILPNVFINYSTTIAIIASIVAVIVLAIIIKNSRISIKNLLKWTGIWIGLGIGALVIGLAISYIISIFTKVKFSLTYMPNIVGDNIITLIVVAVLIVISTIVAKHLVREKDDKDAMILGGLLFNTILMTVFMVVLPGGSYLFLWPIALVIISILLKGRIPGNNGKYILLVPLIFTVTMYIPVIFNIYTALTIGSLGITLLLTLIAISIIIPLGNYILSE
ncbi:M20/M25/M40 family metallo-hydrolase [Clostridium paraputrificum]|uniref:M20/M25/M40 family metallo-hydrolase n=1 Tax=Clostridium paraputrificum TaxID=29363 RepID=UPI003D346788